MTDGEDCLSRVESRESTSGDGLGVGRRMAVDGAAGSKIREGEKAGGPEVLSCARLKLVGHLRCSVSVTHEP